MISVESGIKIPKLKNAGRVEKYPVSSLRVGDSFFVKSLGEDMRTLQRKISAICLMRIKNNKLKIKITVRQVQDPAGIRVWRTK